MVQIPQQPQGPTLGRLIGWGATVVVGLTLIVLLCVGAAFGCASYNRYQKRQDAANSVKVYNYRLAKSRIEIQNQGLRVRIAKQHAAIRYQNAIGIRESQDEIAKTLTPLYVQFEMIDALRQIAQSGSNSSVIYIPTNAKDGLAAVPTLRAGNGK